jgi:large subunit ribosomal protein L33
MVTCIVRPHIHPQFPRPQHLEFTTTELNYQRPALRSSLPPSQPSTWQEKVYLRKFHRGQWQTNDFSTAKSRTIAVRLISMAMTGYYKTFTRPRTSRPLSMLKYDPVGTSTISFANNWMEGSKIGCVLRGSLISRGGQHLWTTAKGGEGE